MSVDWNSIGVSCVMATIAHPLAYARVLVQLGHEPLQPVLGRNMFFRKQYQYPSVFKYLKHIQQRDGYFGIYRGLMPRLCANTVTSITYSVVSNGFGMYMPKENTKLNTDLPVVCRQTFFEMTARCSAIIVSQPFHVIAIRMMAQYIGHETIYDSMHGSIIEIYTEEGLLGFFAGLAPRIAAEVATIWASNILAYLVNTYVLTDTSEVKDIRQYTTIAMSYVVKSFTYPLLLTGTVMAANGANIKASNPPLSPKYDSWITCIKDLHNKGISKRGASMVFRSVASHVMRASSVSPVPVS